MFWELYQQQQIHSANTESLNASNKAQQASDRTRSLEQKVDALSLTCQAMWELLRDHSSLTEDHLKQKVMEIDLRDGVLDGKMRPVKRECPQCQRSLNLRHAKCMYCGFPMPKDHQFDV